MSVGLKELGCGGGSLFSTRHPCTEGQPHSRASLGFWGLVVGGSQPSLQETQLKSSSVATWLCDLGQVTPVPEASKSWFLLMTPCALQLLAVGTFSHT